MRKRVNAWLDGLVRPSVQLFGRVWGAFSLSVCIGLALASLLTLLQAARLGLSLVVMLCLIAAAITLFVGSLIVSKVITGTERLVFYRQALLVLVGEWLILRLGHQPALSYIEVIVLASGACLACCRVGCLMVGCCHGRPCRWGVCYRQEHAEAGFTPHYVGVRLFPIQALELVVVTLVVVGCSALRLHGYPAGTALSWATVVYALARFCLEFGRGNPYRRFFYGFSEAQWVSLFLICLVVWAEHAGLLPAVAAHVGLLLALIAAIVSIAVWRQLHAVRKDQLLHPSHIQEYAEALHRVSQRACAQSGETAGSCIPTTLPTERTSGGIVLSATRTAHASSDIYHYALSAPSSLKTEETLRIMARLLLQLRPTARSAQVLPGNQGILHIVLEMPAP